MSDWKARFFTIWVGQQGSLLGSWIAQFGLVWWLTQKTGSATVLAPGYLPCRGSPRSRQPRGCG